MLSFFFFQNDLFENNMKFFLGSGVSHYLYSNSISLGFFYQITEDK